MQMMQSDGSRCASNPQKQPRVRLDSTDSSQTQSELSELRNVLNLSVPGGHLLAVNNLYARNLAELEESYEQVRYCIEYGMKGTVKVYPFGSLISGLTLKGGDIDLYLYICDGPPMFPYEIYDMVTNFLLDSKDFSEVTPICRARVPIIRCKHPLTGLSIDFNMSHPNSTYSSNFIGELMRHDRRLHDLCLFLKIWSKKLNLGMGSYCLNSMIIVSLQVLRLLPSVRKLQSSCPPLNINGINYAFTFNLAPPIPARMTTLELIRNFFAFYSIFDFEKKVVSPFLGGVLDKKSMLGAPACGGHFPEYKAQILTMQKAGAKPPAVLQLDHRMFVQDFFDLHNNVAKSVSQSSLSYLKQCLSLAAEATCDPELQTQPEKLYEYLLFGLPDKLNANLEEEQPTTSKQHTKELDQMPDLTKLKVKPTAKAPSIVRTHLITPNNNDIKCLHHLVETLVIPTIGRQTMYYYWKSCYVDTIKDVMTKLYALGIKLKSDGLYYHKWRISASLDTWTGRSFQCGEGQSFFSRQLQQTEECLKARAGKPMYRVKLGGYLSVLANDSYSQLRLEVKPLPGDSLALKRNSPLAKLFRSIRNLLNNYSFKEKVANWKMNRESGRNWDS